MRRQAARQSGSNSDRDIEYQLQFVTHIKRLK
jgi:hypothetical protein